jgi:excinuclease UvrABC helicase subunit UvrB
MTFCQVLFQWHTFSETMVKINYKIKIMYNNLFNRIMSEMNYLNKLFDSDKNDNWTKKTFTSDDGLYSYTYISKNYNNEKKDEISLIKKDLQICVENQEFEKAAELRDKIKALSKNKQELEKLNQELSECVKNQDFERAIELRDKIKSLK